MNYYFAPLEGITDEIYRSAHHEFCPGIAKYYTPFIATNQHYKYKPRDIRGILPENNKGLTVVPQVLTNRADQFLRLAEELGAYGYEEINLNLGCPSATVTTKGKGSGFLAHKEELNRFLEEIYMQSPIAVSIKTRLGIEQPEEFFDLLSIYNQYPVKELTIHARVQKDFYGNKPHMDIFKEVWKQSKNPVCYNGDIFTASDAVNFQEQYPEIQAVMIGRGLVRNPGLVCDIRKGDKVQLRAFHDKMYHEYQELLSGDKNVLFKMKESWSYMIHSFTNYESYAKKIQKAERLLVYEDVISALFAEQEYVTSLEK